MTLQSLKMICRLEVGKLGAWSSDFVGAQCIYASDCTTCQVAFLGRKVIISITDVPERFKESIFRFSANFKEISESQIFDLLCDQTSHRAKISHFQNMLGPDLFNVGRAVLMPVVTLRNFVRLAV